MWKIEEKERKRAKFRSREIRTSERTNEPHLNRTTQTQSPPNEPKTFLIRDLHSRNHSSSPCKLNPFPVTVFPSRLLYSLQHPVHLNIHIGFTYRRRRRAVGKWRTSDNNNSRNTIIALHWIYYNTRIRKNITKSSFSPNIRKGFAKCKEHFK